MEKLKNNLAGIAALIGVVGAIGAGFVTYGQMQEKINNLEGVNIDVLIEQIADQNVKIATMEEKLNSMEDIVEGSSEHGHTKILINSKEIELIKKEIEELKVSNKNPLLQ